MSVNSPETQSPMITPPLLTPAGTPMSNSPSITPSTLPTALPIPTYSPPNHHKKSHARKQPQGHIPRPRNAFILFRCDFVRQKKVPADVENDHRNISRVVGQIWREMSDKEKAPWVLMAEKEKIVHGNTYPAYRYAPNPIPGTLKKKKKGEHKFERAFPRVPFEDSPPPLAPPRRSSSCPPPGSAPVSPTREEFEEAFWGVPMVTRDDNTRRQSRVVMYQSIPPPNPFRSNLHESYTFPYARGVQGPLLTTGPYSVALPGTAPGWDAAPPSPQLFPTSPTQFEASSTTSINQFISIPPTETDNIPFFTNPFNPGSFFLTSYDTAEAQEIRMSIIEQNINEWLAKGAQTEGNANPLADADALLHELLDDIPAFSLNPDAQRLEQI